jgi:hypothetical protein
MDHLNKQQLILLALLVSFVSSVDTGIVTVSLYDQANPGITQTINNVIEKTVERVVPADNGASVVTKETVIVSEDDATTNAIDKSIKSIVRISGTGFDGRSFFAGFGVVASTEGKIIARLSKDSNIVYKAVLSGGNEVTLVSLKEDDSNGLVLFGIQGGEGARIFTPATFANSSNVKLGQKVISIAGEVNNSVITSIISGVDDSVSTVPSTPSTKREIFRIRAGIYAQTFMVNSVLVNLSGEIVGLKVGDDADSGYIPSNLIKKLFP